MNTRQMRCFPVSDIAMHVIGPEKARFESRLHAFRLLAPKVFQEISDKYRLMRQAVLKRGSDTRNHLCS